MPCRISHDLSLEDDTFEHSPALSFSSVILLDEDAEYADAQLREQKRPEPYLPVCFLLHCSHINAMTTNFWLPRVDSNHRQPLQKAFTVLETAVLTIIRLSIRWLRLRQCQVSPSGLEPDALRQYAKPLIIIYL